jgi:DnaK suppressor protein
MKHESLTAAQQKTLRRALEEKRAQLLHDIERREQDASESEVESAEMEDVAEGVVEDRDRAALLEHDRALIAEIEHALTRMDAGTYGRSETSGRPISYARLRAVPWARNEAEEAERLEHAARR